MVFFPEVLDFFLAITHLTKVLAFWLSRNRVISLLLPSSGYHNLATVFLPLTRVRICKRVKSLGIDSKESIPPGYVAWRAGTITLFLLGS